MEFHQQKVSLQKQVDLGIISVVDAAEEIAMMNQKEFKIKKQLVDAAHHRAISEHCATESYPNGYFYTRTDNRKLIKAKDVQSLYEKLYQLYYGTEESPYAVKTVFQKAIEEKRETENPKQATLARLEHDFGRFILPELADRNIVEVDHIELKRHTQHLVNSKTLTKKQFLAYKGVLNLIFGYALDHDIISRNPVAKIKNAAYLKSCDTSRAKPEDKIFTPEEIQQLMDICDERMKDGYYVNGYAMKFAVNTGVRAGELCGLKWDDVDFENGVIHIHGQQLIRKVDGHTEYYYAPYTKNERGISEDGRYFPLTDTLRDMLLEMAGWQEELGIQSAYVFCHEDGTWIVTTAYESFLRRICRKCGFKITNNHAFRMSFNSNVLIQNGIAVTDRAQLLGHSVATNLNYYSFAQKDAVEKVRNLLNGLDSKKEPVYGKKEPAEVMIFNSKKALKRLV